jgi:hypothetical protein
MKIDKSETVIAKGWNWKLSLSLSIRTKIYTHVHIYIHTDFQILYEFSLCTHVHAYKYKYFNYIYIFIYVYLQLYTYVNHQKGLCVSFGPAMQQKGWTIEGPWRWTRLSKYGIQNDQLLSCSSANLRQGLLSPWNLKGFHRVSHAARSVPHRSWSAHQLWDFQGAGSIFSNLTCHRVTASESADFADSHSCALSLEMV